MKDFTALPNRLISEADTSAVISVYAAIAWHKSKKEKPTDLVFPSMKTIADMANVSKTTAIAAVKWLRGRGFLIVNSHPGHSQGFVYEFPGLDGKTGPNEEPVQNSTGPDEAPLFIKTGPNEIPQPVQNRYSKKIYKKKTKINTFVESPNSDSRHAQFRDALSRYWEFKNGSSLIWDASEGKALALLLKASPELTVEQFTEALRNRTKSDINHGVRVRQWIGDISKFFAGPIDRYGNVKGTQHGQPVGNRSQQRTAGNVAALHNVLESLDLEVARDSGGSAPGSHQRSHPYGLLG